MTPDSPSDPDVQRVETSAGVLSYTDVGEGPAVLAIHGLPGSSRDYRWLGSAIEEQVRFIRLEMPGFGGSPAPRRVGTSLSARAQVVRQFVDAVGLERSVVVGHSMGGGVAAAFAASVPERVAGLALLASIGLRPHRGLRNMGMMTKWMGALLAIPGVQPRVMPRIRAQFERSGFSGHRDEALALTLRCLAGTSFSDHARNVRALRVPTMVSWCRDDALVEDAIGEELYWACPPGPRVVFSEGGHNLQKSRAIELGEALVVWCDSLQW